MSAQWPLPLYTDGDFTVAQPISLPIFNSPRPDTTNQYVFKQLWMQYLANVTPLALNTAHPSAGATPDYSTYYLIAESEKEDCGGGIVKWWRTYSAVPASYNDWETIAYSFIGTAPLGPLSTYQVGRNRFSERVKCRVQNDFFMVGVGFTDPITGAVITSGAFTNPGIIPEVWALAYCGQQLTSGGSPTLIGGLFYRVDYVCDPLLVAANVGAMWHSTPSATEYAAMILDATTNGWGATASYQQIDTATYPVASVNCNLAIPPASANYGAYPSPHSTYGGQIIAENSTIERWQRSGNIWVRKTKYVLAQ